MSAEEAWVEVVPYDRRWYDSYLTESSSIRDLLGSYALGIEHFGSTSVPGLVAKPIVDILVGAPDNAAPTPAIHALSSRGYEYLGEDARRPGRFFWRKRGADSFNVSVVSYGGPLWRSNIAVRDFLRTHPDWAARYGQVKRGAVAAAGSSMLAYQDHKRAFADQLRVEALAWFEGPDYF